MKFLKQTVVFLVLCFSIKTLQAQTASADIMANKIFTAFQTKDEKAFIALYPNKEQTMRLVTQMMTGVMEEIKKSPEAMKELRKESNGGNIDSLLKSEFEKKASDEEMAKMHQRYSKDFNKWIKLGEEKGIDWNTAQLVKTDIDTAVVDDEGMQKLFGSDKFRSMKGMFHLTSNNKAYQIKFDQVMFLPEEDGWYGVKIKSLGKEGEPLAESENEDLETEDVMIESVPEVLPPPPPPAPKKPKAKTKTSSTKSKTKS